MVGLTVEIRLWHCHCQISLVYRSVQKKVKHENNTLNWTKLHCNASYYLKISKFKAIYYFLISKLPLTSCLFLVLVPILLCANEISFTCKFNSFWVMCTKGIRCEVLIGTLDWHPDRYSVKTVSTLDQQSVESWLSVERLIWIAQKLVDSWPTVDGDVDGVPIECQPRCWWSVNWVSSEVIDRHWAADAFSTHNPSFSYYWLCTRPPFDRDA